MFEVGEDAFFPSIEAPRELLEGIESAAGATSDPLLEKGFGLFAIFTSIEVGEVFFEQIGLMEVLVQRHDFVEGLALFAFELVPALEPKPSRTFDERIALFFHGPVLFIATDLIDGFAEIAIDMELVEDHSRLLQVPFDAVVIGAPEIGADRLGKFRDRLRIKLILLVQQG